MGLISFLSQWSPVLPVLFIEKGFLSQIGILDTFAEAWLPMLFAEILCCILSYSGLVYTEVASFLKEETSDTFLASDETQSSPVLENATCMQLYWNLERCNWGSYFT